jgi:hypothetical protein
VVVEVADTQLTPLALQPTEGAMAHMELVGKMRFPILAVEAVERVAEEVKIVQVAMVAPVSLSFVTQQTLTPRHQ